MKKKSILMRVGVVAAALTLATTGMTSGTLAKYTASLNGAATAIVAKWDPHVYSEKGTQDETTEILLGDTVRTLNTNFSENGANPNAVKDGPVQYVMPGMKGEVPLYLSAGGSQMDIKYSVKIYNWDEGTTGPKYNNPSNLIFYTTAGDYKTLPGVKKGEEIASGYLAGSISVKKHPDLPKQKDLILTWEWPLTYTSGKVLDAEITDEEDYNKADTADVKTIGSKEMGFTVKITFEQATGLHGDDAYNKGVDPGT